MPPSLFPLIDHTGPRRKRGRQYGAAEICLAAVARLTCGAAGLRALVGALVPIIERVDRDEAAESSAGNQPSHCALHSAAARNVPGGQVAMRW